MLRHFPSILLLSCSSLLLNIPSSHGAESTPARWWKGNTHTHTLWSDGNDFPEMVTDWYVKQGYNFLGISDHNILHAKEVWMSEDAIKARQKALGRTAMAKYVERFGDEWVETREEKGKTQVRLKKLEEYRPKFEKAGKFLLIQAEELSASYEQSPKVKVPVHINAVNLTEEMKPIEGTSTLDVLRRNLQAIRDQEKKTGVPIMAHVNHPNFRWALTAEMLGHAIEENFFEIFNGHPGINYKGDETRIGHEKIWDIANTIRLSKLNAHPLFGMGTDDSHHYHGEANESTPGRGWVMVRAAELKPDALVKAMRAGDFYASSGVTLEDVSFSDGVLKIRIKPDAGATYTTRIVGTPKEHDATTREVPSPEGDPNPVRLAYSDDIGKTFATIEGTDVSYKLTGKELYVRAVVTSNQKPVNPSFEGQLQMAWTQPVGWKVAAGAN